MLIGTAVFRDNVQPPTIKPVEVGKLQTQGLQIIQGNSVIGMRQPSINRYLINSLGYYSDFQGKNEDYMVSDEIGEIFEDECFYRIIKAESNFNPNAINKNYGISGGVGLGQLIPSTIKYCEEKLGIKIDPFNPIDNLECSWWLYKNEGTKHWGCSNCWWGSWNKWHKYCY